MFGIFVFLFFLHFWGRQASQEAENLTAKRSRRRDSFSGWPALRKNFESSVESSADRPRGSVAWRSR